MRAFLIVLDSVGIGAAPDAADYGDEGSNTLGHLARAAGGLRVPLLQQLGLGRIPPLIPGGIPIEGCPATDAPLASFGALRERSQGKDTTTGHWEMAGLLVDHGFTVFPKGPPSFPASLMEAFVQRTGRPALGNKAASGTAIIEELGPRQMAEGAWIVYTSADSVFQVAAHEEIIPLAELYRGCEIARELCTPLHVGRVIARPYVGVPGSFRRTENRRDFSHPLPGPTILDHLQGHGVHTVTVGKLDDVFAGRGIDEVVHDETNASAQAALMRLLASPHDPMFVFANFIDFDMLYGHRRDAKGYAAALERTDGFLREFQARLRPDDWLIITADHGNDPTFRGSDHTREYVPLLSYRPGLAGVSLGIRDGFYDIASSLAAYFSAPPMARGVSFL